MSGPFKMKGSSGLGYGNQHSEGKSPAPMMEAIAGIAGKLMSKKDEEASPAPYASPAKNTPGVDFNDPKVKANYEKYKDNAEYQKALNKKTGGETTYNAEENTSTTKKVKK
jgi:hypothetical protein